jgi:hypothetical protein
MTLCEHSQPGSCPECHATRVMAQLECRIRALEFRNLDLERQNQALMSQNRDLAMQLNQRGTHDYRRRPETGL